MITSQPDRLPRCPWSGQDPLYLAYHDDEWGVPEYDDRALYEKLVLDGFQAGLSWIIILRKRDNLPRLRRLRSAENRALRCAQESQADGRRRHRAQPAEGRWRGAIGARLS